jgi:hypothetical protein
MEYECSKGTEKVIRIPDELKNLRPFPAISP